MNDAPEGEKPVLVNVQVADGAARAAAASVSLTPVILEARRLTIRYGDVTAVRDISLPVREQQVTAIIGPSGCGKSTLLRHFNRLNEFFPGVHAEGEVLFRGVDLYGPAVNPVEIRRRIGMVFQKPTPFPKSIYENVAWGPQQNKLVPSRELPELVEHSLRQANLWQEVQDRLDHNAIDLSGGQQQRLCIARTIAMQPEVILMDEPCGALDPKATAAIESLIFELKHRYTIVIVTHDLLQAPRVSDFTAFLAEGALIEFGPTIQVFTSPARQETADYIAGRFG